MGCKPSKRHSEHEGNSPPGQRLSRPSLNESRPTPKRLDFPDSPPRGRPSRDRSLTSPPRRSSSFLDYFSPPSTSDAPAHSSGVSSAPPRLSLDIYGGPYSIERFRGASDLTATLLSPPFVASYMVCEEREVDPKISALGVNGISTST